MTTANRYSWNAVALDMFFTRSQRACRRRPRTVQLVVVVWINRVASEIVISSYIPKSHPGFPQRHSWNGDTLDTSCGRGLKVFAEGDHSRRHTGEHSATWCWFVFQSCRQRDSPQPVHVPAGTRSPWKLFFHVVSKSLLDVNMSVPSARRQVLSRWVIARAGSVVSGFMRDRMWFHA